MPWNDNVFTRTFGAGPYPVEPFIRGYGFCYIELPAEIGGPEISVKLAALARSVSGLGNITLDSEAIEGLGGVKFSIPTKLTMPDRVSVEYMEITDAFVFNVHKKWINLIRDIRYGSSNLMDDDYVKEKYAGTMFIWFTKPDGKTVQEAYVLRGVFPAILPLDALGFNITDVAKVDITFDYVFDMIFFYRKDHEDVNDIVNRMFEQKLGNLIDQVKQTYIKFSENFN